MNILTRPTLRTRWKNVAIGLGAIGLFLFLARSVALGNLKATLVSVAIASLPIFIYVTLRWPLFFPFGLYVVMVPFDPLLSFVGSGATLTKIIGIAAIGALAFRAVLSRRILVPPKSWYAWGAFILLMTMSIAWSISIEDTLNPLKIMGSLFALFTMLSIYPITFAELKVVRRLIIAAGLITAAFGFYTIQTSQRSYRPTDHGEQRLMLTSGHIQMDPNHYAAFFLIPISFVVVRLLAERGSWFVKLAYVAMFAAMSAQVALSGSRGGLLGVGIVVVYLGFRSRRIVATSAVLACGFFISLAIPSVWQRFADKTQGDGSGRFEIWSTGLRAFHDFWLIGSGFGTYPDAYDSYLLLSYQRLFNGWHRPAHDLFVSILVELGIVGTGVLIVTLWITWRQNARIPRTHPLFSMRLATESALIGMFWMSLTIDVLWYKYIWLVLGFNVLLANVYNPRAFRSPASSRFMPARTEVAMSRDPARVRF